jgi:putative addiction module component (TIGR02574 family)
LILRVLFYTLKMQAATITTECLKLSVSERIQLVEDLWDSVANEAPASIVLTTEQSVELHARLAAHRANPSSAVPWDQVRASLYATSH